MEKPGYHITKIPKGQLGHLSKIKEEILELEDAELQGSKIMIHVELADLYGAIEAYAERQGLTMNDLKYFSDITKRAFRNGARK
jgi:phosphoribosyl-ATP pyrophosphohydrolase